MEFLDPDTKRARTVRLFTGYILIAIGIGLMSLILVYLAQGFGYDRKAGIVQSGLAIIDSHPVSGNVYVDDKQKGKTKTQFTLKEGEYQIKIAQAKYRDWQKTVSIIGGSVNYLMYPILFPINIAINDLQPYSQAPALVTQSPDRRWLVVQPSAVAPTFSIVDLQNPDQSPTSITVPQSVIPAKDGQYGSLAVSEWSDDNKHLVLTRSLQGTPSDYILIDREDVGQSINLTNKLGLKAGQLLSLRDKKYDKYYVHYSDNGELHTAELKNGIQALPMITGVVSYKSYGDNLILYVTYDGAQAADARVMVQSNKSDIYYIQTFARNPDNRYLLDMAQFQDNWYYGISNIVTNKAQLFINPLSGIKSGNGNQVLPKQTLLINSPQAISFSDNTRFMALQSGKRFLVSDNELHKVYRFTSPLNIADNQIADWMDGHRFSIVTDRKAQVFEFDGSNQQTLTDSLPQFNPYFSRDYSNLYTIVAHSDNNVKLQQGSLIAK